MIDTKINIKTPDFIKKLIKFKILFFIFVPLMSIGVVDCDKHFKDMSKQEKRYSVEELIEKAEKGDADAQYELGLMYLEGKGVKKSYNEAFEWLLGAAHQGDADYQYKLAKIYLDAGVYDRAFDWLRRAAEQLANHPHCTLVM